MDEIITGLSATISVEVRQIDSNTGHEGSETLILGFLLSQSFRLSSCLKEPDQKMAYSAYESLTSSFISPA